MEQLSLFDLPTDRPASALMAGHPATRWHWGLGAGRCSVCRTWYSQGVRRVDAYSPDEVARTYSHHRMPLWFHFCAECLEIVLAERSIGIPLGRWPNGCISIRVWIADDEQRPWRVDHTPPLMELIPMRAALRREEAA